MSSPGKQNQAESRWGSFLSQAVAGVEARLDNILAETDNAPAKSSPTVPSPAPASPSKSNAGPSRTSSTHRINDRLQERLARAMAAKSGASKPGLSSADATASSRLSSTSTQPRPRLSLETSSRASTDSTRSAQIPTKESSSPLKAFVDTAIEESNAQPQDSPNGEPATTTRSESPPVENAEKKSLDSFATMVDHAENASAETGPGEPPPTSGVQVKTGRVEEVASGRVGELEKALEEARVQHEEETHSYIERVDALEAKLQFLAREMGESARKTALAAPSASVEKKLAERDQQIAQLMEEGKNLATSEQKYRTVIKKLRLKATEDDKELAKARSAKEKAEKDVDALRPQARRVSDMEKQYADLQKKLGQAQREANMFQSEAVAKDAVILKLRAELDKAHEHADGVTAQVSEQAHEQDRRRIAELEDTIAALRVEHNLVAERGRAQANQLREKAEQATEQARALELELKAEVQVMEGKLEGMRARAEESLSGAKGDEQAKLLRQVETLQTQYSVASENWQGIEATLLARMAGLEKERDEALQREADMRRKAREAAARAKRNEEALEESRIQLPGLHEDVKRAFEAQLGRAKKRNEELEAALAESRVELEKQTQALREELQEKEAQVSRPPTTTDLRRGAWLEDLAGATPPFLKGVTGAGETSSRPASPLLSLVSPATGLGTTPPRRNLSSDLLGMQANTVIRARKSSGPPSNGSEAGGMGMPAFGRRSCAQPSVTNRPSVSAMPPNPLGLSIGVGNCAQVGSTSFTPHSLDPIPSPSVLAPPHHPLDHQEQLEGGDTFDHLETLSQRHGGQQPQSRSRPPSRTLSSRPQSQTATPTAPQHQTTNSVLQDMVSVSTVAAGPSVQLVERMSAAIRRLESERVAAREELASMARQRDEARAEIVSLMRDAELARAAAASAEQLEKEVAEVKARYETTLEMLGEKSELVDELRADVEDVKAMYRDLVERTVK